MAGPAYHHGFLWTVLLLCCLTPARASSGAGWSGGAQGSGAEAATPQPQERHSGLLHSACTSFELDDTIAILARNHGFSPLGSASLQPHISSTPGDEAFRLRVLLEPWRGAGYNLSASARALVTRTLPNSCLTPSAPALAATAAATAVATGDGAGGAASGGDAGASTGDVLLSGMPIETSGLQRRLQSAAFSTAVPVTIRLVPWQADAGAAAAGAAPGAMAAELEVPVGAFTCEVVPRRRSSWPRNQQQGNGQGQGPDDAAAAEQQQQQQDQDLDEVEEATRTLFVQLELTITGPGAEVHLATVGSSYNALPGGCTYATIIASCNPAVCRASASAAARRQRRQLAEAVPAAAAALASLERMLGKPLPVQPAVAVAVAAVAASVLVLLPVGALMATGVRRLQMKRREWAAAAAAGGATAAAAAAALALRRSGGGGGRSRSRSRNLSRRGSLLGSVCEDSLVASTTSGIGGGTACATAGGGSSGLCSEGPGSAPATPMRPPTSGVGGGPGARISGGGSSSGNADGGGGLTPPRQLHSTLSERSRSPSPGMPPRRVSCGGMIGSGGGGAMVAGGGAYGCGGGPGSGHCTPSRLSCMSGGLSGSDLNSATATPLWSSCGSRSSRGYSEGSAGHASRGPQVLPAFVSASGIPPPDRRNSCNSGLARCSSSALASGSSDVGAIGSGSSSSVAAAALAAAAPSSGSSSPALLPRDAELDGLQMRSSEGGDDAGATSVLRSSLCGGDSLSNPGCASVSNRSAAGVSQRVQLLPPLPPPPHARPQPRWAGSASCRAVLSTPPPHPHPPPPSPLLPLLPLPAPSPMSAAAASPLARHSSLPAPVVMPPPPPPPQLVTMRPPPAQPRCS